eukprot:TRINITY_DN5460_c0_g1_i11.p1 TRINITY_DN5460_c0_g1~~TRINITY_DN5460_c0_g1_i11.p1  ORF type:complete len:138 (+),score=26.26 TRINITY_DN5460_c0_g1_i11:42-455(+)
MSVNRNCEAGAKADHVRKSLLKDICSLTKVRESSDVRIVLSSYERAGGLRVHKCHSYPEMLSAKKALKKFQCKILKAKPRETRRVVDARLCDAGFGGRILERLLAHSEQSAKDSNRSQLLNAVKCLRIMGFELRSTL